MKEFWLEEYYKADYWTDEMVQSDVIEAGSADPSGLAMGDIDSTLLRRNLLFDANDVYFKMGDIRQVARRILEDEE